jgi:hypothetical protein
MNKKKGKVNNKKGVYQRKKSSSRKRDEMR